MQYTKKVKEKLVPQKLVPQQNQYPPQIQIAKTHIVTNTKISTI